MFRKLIFFRSRKSLNLWESPAAVYLPEKIICGLGAKAEVERNGSNQSRALSSCQYTYGHA